MAIGVYKFGGISLNSAVRIKKVVRIIRQHQHHPLIVIVSAMGKMTNALEEVLKHYLAKDAVSMIEAFERVYDFHIEITDTLFRNRKHLVYSDLESLFDRLRGYLRKGHIWSVEQQGYDYEYDQIVSYGELLSSTIMYHYLSAHNHPCRFLDARNLIRTDDHYRDARIDWDRTEEAIQSAIPSSFDPESGHFLVLTQGFIGSCTDGTTTTLGREGSDFTAAIFAFILKAPDITIWKDVPGVLNADPKWFKRPKKLETLSYREAIELAYYGASVIHPKTIKPLENANIRLHVKSFLQPSAPGTVIENIDHWTIGFPIFIRKENQVLISISPRDFSFIVEHGLGATFIIDTVFNILVRYRVKVNVMQNSAISFLICIDRNDFTLEPLIDELSKTFEIRYNVNTELFTIRHYTPEAIRNITRNKTVLLEQKTRSTIHLVLV